MLGNIVVRLSAKRAALSDVKFHPITFWIQAQKVLGKIIIEMYIWMWTQEMENLAARNQDWNQVE